MKKPRPSPIDCVIKDAVNNYVLRRGTDDDTARPEELGAAAPLKRLLDISLTAEELEKPDIAGSLSCSISDLVGSEEEAGNSPERTLEAVNRTLAVIKDQVQNIDLEIQMLNLRKKALKRRSKILEKLAESLDGYRDMREAA